MRPFFRYLAILRVLVLNGLMRQMAYRPHFFLMVTGKVIRIALLVLFFQALFSRVDRLGTWSFDQVLLLFATFHVVDFVISFTFHRNLAFSLTAKVQSGDLDSRMLMPVSLLFLVSLESIDVQDFLSFLPTLGFLGYVLWRMDLPLTASGVALYLVLMAAAVAFLFAAVLAVASLSFWTTQSRGLARIFDNAMKVGRYPLDIFEGFARVLFAYVLPLVLIAQVPSQALIGTLTPGGALFALAFTAAALAGSLLLWRRGLRAYSSAST